VSEFAKHLFNLKFIPGARIPASEQLLTVSLGGGLGKTHLKHGPFL
jgi:hypothetical protein